MDLKEFRGRDDLEKFAAAMEWLRAHPHSELFIEPGTYVLTGASEKQFFNDVIAGKYGDNPQACMFRPDLQYTRALDFYGQEGTRVYAEGVTLLFDGFFEPISLRHCKNITVQGLTIDYLRKPYSKGDILSVQAGAQGDELTVRFSDFLPDTFNSPRVAVYDNRSGIFTYYPFAVQAKERIDGNTFRLTVSGAAKQYEGGELYVWHFFHSRPAICIQNAENITLRNVTIHAHPGMGVVGHLSKDIYIDGLAVVPSAGERMSTNTDATHFASCYGKLILQNCVFDGQGDDAVNVHTYYHSITPLGGQQYRLQCLASEGTHTLATDAPFVGDRLQLTERGTLTVVREYTVLKCAVNEDGTCTVDLDGEIEADPADFYVANAAACPEFVFSHCRARNHLARAVLIKTKRAVVEHCIFEHTNLTAVVVAAEEDWKEGISSEKVTIRNNVFIHCSMQGDVASAVAVYTGSEKGTGKQHGEINIENNTIICPPGLAGISVRNVENPIVANNTIVTERETV